MAQNNEGAIHQELYYDGVIVDESSGGDGKSENSKNNNNGQQTIEGPACKRNAAYAILLPSLGSQTQSLLFSKLNTVTKTKNELIEQYIARVDNIICDLSSMGTAINAAQHKYHLLINGLSKLDEWTLCVQYISQHDIDDSLTLPAIYKLLINEETKRRITSEKNNITKHHDDAIALYNNHNNKFNNKHAHGHNNNNNKHNNRTKNEHERTPALQVPNICWHYNSDAGCKNGDTCKFAHIELCKFFAENGKCRFGDKCIYIHNKPHRSNNNKSGNNSGNNYGNKSNNNSARGNFKPNKFNNKNKNGAMAADNGNSSNNSNSEQAPAATTMTAVAMITSRSLHIQ